MELNYWYTYADAQQQGRKSPREAAGRGRIIQVNAEMLFEEGEKHIPPLKSAGPKRNEPDPNYGMSDNLSSSFIQPH